jgi:hypothetical protein
MSLSTRMSSAAGLLSQALGPTIDKTMFEAGMGEIRKAIEEEVSRLEREIKRAESRARHPRSS